MRRLTALCCLLISAATYAAVPTITVTGSIVTPSGATATGGTIACTLSANGSVLDGSTNQRLAVTRSSGTISALGAVTGLTLVPNDVITPAGTQYSCVVTVSGPVRSSWTEPNWTIASSPATIDIGAISRPGVTPLTVSGVSGVSGQVQASNGSGALTTVTALVGSTSQQDMDGDGTVSGADWDFNGTADESGAALTYALRVDKLYGAAATSTVDTIGDGTVATFSAGRTRVSLLMDAYAHASRYGDPNYYLMPAVFDAYLDVLKGRPMMASHDGLGNLGAAATSDAPEIAMQMCPGAPPNGTCSNVNNYICTNLTGRSVCVGGTQKGIDCAGGGAATCTGGGGVCSTVKSAYGLDYTGDGTPDIQVGDVVTLKTASSLTNKCPNFVVSGIVDGDASHCGTTYTKNYIQIEPALQLNDANCGIDTNADGTVDATARIATVWRNNTHLQPAAYYQLGYQLGYGSRTIDGQQGPNLLPASDLTQDGTQQTWTFGGSATFSVANTLKYPAETSAQCFNSSFGAAQPTGTTHNGTAIVDAMSRTRDLKVGWYLIGPYSGSPVINSIDSDTQVTVSTNGTGNNTGYQLYFAPNADVPGCWTMGASAANKYAETTTSIAVKTGMTYVLSGVVGPTGDSLRWDIECQTAAATWATAYGLGRYSYAIDGTGNTIKKLYNNYPGRFFFTWTAPDQCPTVKLRLTNLTGTASRPLVDGVEFRRLTTFSADDMTAKKSYLINDPGTRNIVIAWDSWAKTDTLSDYGYQVKAGLAAALLERFGRDVSAQIVPVGLGGTTTSTFLNSWYTQVDKYAPLYLVLTSGGLNDQDPANNLKGDVARFQRNVLEIAARARAEGIIPIFVSSPPKGGSQFQYQLAQMWRNIQRRTLLNMAP